MQIKRLDTDTIGVDDGIGNYDYDNANDRENFCPDLGVSGVWTVGRVTSMHAHIYNYYKDSLQLFRFFFLAMKGALPVHCFSFLSAFCHDRMH